MMTGGGGYGSANSRGGTLRDRAGCSHREEVVESTISLPLHTVGTWCPLAEAGKKEVERGRQLVRNQEMLLN